ncbi:MAG: response regulator [Bacteroidota bacterium]
MPLRLLHLEDNARDAEMIAALLLEAEIHFDVSRVDSKESFVMALEKHEFGLILCDYNLPSFDGNTALGIARRKYPDTPFIFVSGTIGEDRAIEALKSGATDYVLKDRLVRLVPAVRRALQEVEERKARLQLEEQLIRAQRMESIGVLASGIAHDLNNVLGPIMLGIEVIRRNAQDPRSLRMLETMAVSAKRGAAILKQVLGIARGGKGDKRLLQPRYIIDEVVNLIRQTFPRSIKVISDIQRDVPAIEADPTQLHQVLLNICINARDAMAEYGELKIALEKTEIDESLSHLYGRGRRGEYVVLSVTDTGTGIPPEIIEQIFDPFFTTKESGKGTGLGLSTVSSIVRGHDGFVTVDSETGKGTTFRVYFPAAKQEMLEKSVESKTEMRQGNGELILVVDDEVSIREITREMLETQGYSAVTASDGAEAIAIYLRGKDAIKAVVMDLVMPILSGPDTIKTLRRINPNLTIIAVSGMTFEGETDVVPEGDIRVMLRKPYSSELLLQAIAEALGKTTE